MLQKNVSTCGMLFVCHVSKLFGPCSAPLLAALPAAAEHAARSIEPYVRTLSRLYENAAPEEEQIKCYW